MRTILIPVLVVGVATTGCQDEPAAADDDRISVVASFYPLAFIVERIGGDCVTVTNLTPPGVEPHDLELSPDAVESIATADLVLYLGGGFQPAIEEALQDAEGRTMDGLGVVSTNPPGGGPADEGFTVDPHVWLDPSRFRDIVSATAEALED